MKIGISIDKAGRLVLPKEVRQKLDLQAGDLLDAELVANEVRLRRKLSSPAGFQRVEGRLVWDVLVLLPVQRRSRMLLSEEGGNGISVPPECNRG